MANPDCVQVAIRVRPLINSEIQRGCNEIIEKTKGEPQLNVLGVSAASSSNNCKPNDPFTFTHVFMPEDPQEQVYEESVRPLIDKLFEGYNVTILAYGQTGSGKTYTMGTAFDGDFKSDVGVIPRATLDIFKKIEQMKEHYEVTATCSFTELYQETLYDLLSGKPRDQSICDIREERSKGIYISGVTRKHIESPEETGDFLSLGSSGRAVGATAMNSVSSRSHAIFTIDIKTTKLDVEGESTNAKFHLVDLAGSERSKKTKATGERFKEGVKINQGLLALGNVISALGGGSGNGTGSYISYRDSKLTRLLQDSLGGNSVTLMIACISPADYNIEETLSTLRYADRAKKIKNKPIINQDSQSAEIQRLKEVIQDLRVKLLSYTSGTELPRDINSSLLMMGSDETERRELLAKIKEKEREMHELMQSVCGNAYKLALFESHSFQLHKDVQELIELLTETCPAEYAVPDTNIFTQINAITARITDLMGKFDEEMAKIQDISFKPDTTIKNDVHVERKTAAFAKKQMDFQSQLRDLEQELQMKQTLLSKKAANSALYQVDGDAEKTILEYESVIKNYEKELDELRCLNQTTKSKDAKTVKLSEDRRLKIKNLETELAEAKKKARQYEKTKRAQEQDRRKIEDLQREIQEMKTLRVRLLRESRQEAESYKKWMQNREKEIFHLKEMSKKQENQMKRMNVLHEKQQLVLRRKVEEAKSINKRLQEAIEKGKKAQAMRNNSNNMQEKTDIIQTWIDHELSLLMSITDAQISLKHLMKDRGLLTERLGSLKATVSKSDAIEAEISRLEEDLEMRNAQISDIQQKVIQTDIENKLKSLPDNFSGLVEAKIAMRYVLMAFIQLRKDFSSMKVKSEDIKTCLETAEERCENLQEENLELNEKIKEHKNRLEKEFEDKLAICIQKFQNGPGTGDQESVALDRELGVKIVHMAEENSMLRDRVQELEKQLAEKNSRKRVKQEIRDEDEEGIDENLESDSDEEFDFNDSFNDPDWRKTPMAKRGRLRRTANLLKESIINSMDIADDSNESSGFKRNSRGQQKFLCKCKGSCATKQCGCKRFDNFCSDNCKCSIACVNKADGSNELQENDEEDEEGKLDQAEGGTEENVESLDHTPKKLKPNDSSPDLFTTPYYPYEKKKREPLLRI